MIAVGADHGGFKLKEQIKNYYKNEVKDFGTYDEERGLEEPKVAIAVAEAVANGECDMGVLICRSGIGMVMAANKVKKVRCALAYNKETALSAKEHNNANVLALGADFVSFEEAIKRIELWKNAKFLNGIYQERLAIVEKYEEEKE